MNYNQLENYVHQLYSSVAILTPEHINMHDIAQKLNIRLHLWDECSQSNRYKGICRIFLDKRLEANKQWSEFAQELCCILKHTGNRIDTIPVCHTLLKMKSSHFARHFCVPTFMLETLNLPSDKHYAIAYVSQIFNVEAELAENRLNQWAQRSKCSRIIS